MYVETYGCQMNVSDSELMLGRLAADGYAEASTPEEADVILFVYRDEVYNPETDARGTAELIIGKHRNGPTGTARCAFIAEQARFASLTAPSSWRGD